MSEAHSVECVMNHDFIQSPKYEWQGKKVSRLQYKLYNKVIPVHTIEAHCGV
jgi:hypothetical protein